VIFLFLLALSASAHAISRHGEAALQASDACSNNPVLVAINPETCRVAIVGETQEGKYAISINDTDGICITCFIKEKLQSLAQVKNYLLNRGYIK